MPFKLLINQDIKFIQVSTYKYTSILGWQIIFLNYEVNV